MKLNSVSLITLALLFGLAAGYHWFFLVPCAVMVVLAYCAISNEVDEIARQQRPEILKQAESRWPGES